MKQRLLTSIKTILVTASLVAVPLVASPAHAINVFSAGCGAAGGGTSGAGTGTSTGTGTGSGSGSICGAAQQDNFTTLMKNIINTILIVLGMIAVVMIVIGGIRYTTSNGDSSQIKAAKDTILYAVVGLVVAILSYAIVNFVINSFIK